jgi:enterochelin esterase family protein
MIHTQKCFITFFPPEQAAYLIGDFTDWDERPLPISGAITLEFPEGAYVEYAFLDAQKQPFADEANPQRPAHPWYEYHRACFLPGNNFQKPPHSSVLQGEITKHIISSQVLEQPRTCIVYEPPLSPIATLYIQDGEAFYHKLMLHQVADALITQKTIYPVRLVFIEPHDRVSDYWFNVRYETFLLESVLPLIERVYGATAQRGLWGASLGGMVSIWLAWRNASAFPLVVSQSGCFTADPKGGDYYHDAEWLTDQLARTELCPVRFYVETGQIEWLLAPNRRFAAMLAEKEYSHRYVEHPGGHCWATWEQGLVPGLCYLFGKESFNASAFSG